MRSTIASPVARPRKPRGMVAPPELHSWRWLLTYLVFGVFLGILLMKSEVVSWFRIQEMFRFQGFHMYGFFAAALAVAIPSVAAIKRSNLRALSGEPVQVPPRAMGSGYRYALGGTIFGVGWAFTGACPGPLYALPGAGIGVMAVAILSAVVGAWVYGYLQPKLPH